MPGGRPISPRRWPSSRSGSSPADRPDLKLSGPCVPALRTRQAELIAQRRAFILGPEQSARLQFGDHKRHEIVEPSGNVRGLDEEAVAGVVEKPSFHLVDDLLGRADERTLAARPGEAHEELPDAELLLAGP